MANYSTLVAGIVANIRQNDTGAVTGAILQEQLLNMIVSLGAGYQFMGVATPSTNPGTPDAKVFYIASEAGTYTNFGGIVVAEGEVAILKWDSAWSKEVTGAATADQLNQLGQEINGVADFVPIELSLSVNQYHGVTSGGTKISVATTAREGTNCSVLECSPGDKFKIYGKGTATLRLYVFADSSNNILLSNSGTIDTRTGGLEITAPADTTNLYINFLDYDSSTDKLEKYTVESGIISRLVDLENNAILEADIVDNLTSNDSTKPLSAKQGKVLNEMIVGSEGYIPQVLQLEMGKYWANVADHTYVSNDMYSREGTSCCRIAASEGEKYKIFGKGTNLIKLYAFTNDSNLILSSNTENVNTRTEGEIITAPAGATRLYINFLDYDGSTDKLERSVLVEGLEQRVAALENEDKPVVLYKGKKIIAFGDSITEFKWDGTGGDGKGWVDHAAETLGCEFVNVAIGGAHMNVRSKVELFDATHDYSVGDYVFHKPSDTMNIYVCINAHSGAWDASDFQDESNNSTVIGGIAYYPLFVWGMIQAFCDVDTSDMTERFKNQIAAAECIYTWKSSHDDNRAIVQHLVETDPADIAAVVILHGANDYATYGYWGTSGSFDTTTLLGAINQSVKELNSTFKDKPIFFVTPPVRWFSYSEGTGEPQNFSDYYVREGSPKSYKQFVYDILVNEYKLNHVPVCDLYGELQWTMWNFSNYFPDNDGTHPRQGFGNIGAKIASFLLANNVLKPLTN